MTLEQLQHSMMSAMKRNDTMRRDVLRSVIAAAKKAAIDARCEVSEELLDKVLLKEAKTLQEMIDTCPDERVDLKFEYGSKAAILNEYVPKLIDDPEAIAFTISELLADAGIELRKANKGAVMKTIMPHFKGKADMKVVNQVVSEILL